MGKSIVSIYKKNNNFAHDQKFSPSGQMIFSSSVADSSKFVKLGHS